MPKQPDSWKTPRIATEQLAVRYGILTLSDVSFQRTLTAFCHRKRFSKLQFAKVALGDFKFELFPLHSPLLTSVFKVLI